jgi:hypothetical protein
MCQSRSTAFPTLGTGSEQITQRPSEGGVLLTKDRVTEDSVAQAAPRSASQQKMSTAFQLQKRPNLWRSLTVSLVSEPRNFCGNFLKFGFWRCFLFEMGLTM